MSNRLVFELVVTACLALTMSGCTSATMSRQVSVAQKEELNKAIKFVEVNGYSNKLGDERSPLFRGDLLSAFVSTDIALASRLNTVEKCPVGFRLAREDERGFDWVVVFQYTDRFASKYAPRIGKYGLAILSDKGEFRVYDADWPIDGQLVALHGVLKCE